MTTKDKKKAHLLDSFSTESTAMRPVCGATQGQGGWSFSTPEYWQHMARTMERGLFDAMFIADELAPYNTHENSSDAIVKWAVAMPDARAFHDRPDITTATKHLGVGLTLSTAFEHPIRCAAGYRALTTSPPADRVEYRILLFEERVGRLWPLHDGAEGAVTSGSRVHGVATSSGFLEPGAIIADKAGDLCGSLEDQGRPSRGKYYKCDGRHFCAPVAAGRPFCGRRLFRAGRDFAAKHAEAILPFIRTSTDAAISGDLTERLTGKFNRAPGSVKRIYGLQTVVADNAGEAQDKYERIKACIPPEGALAWMSGHFGLDFSTYSPTPSCKHRGAESRDCSNRSSTKGRAPVT
jgi:alkanesulfonate monooxygenase SsuD/methylene tetrahydromethanopterin reductase-like flavin-dependent oxidoreductase (luciferase family)